MVGNVNGAEEGEREEEEEEEEEEDAEAEEGVAVLLYSAFVGVARVSFVAFVSVVVVRIEESPKNDWGTSLGFSVDDDGLGVLLVVAGTEEEEVALPVGWTVSFVSFDLSGIADDVALVNHKKRLLPLLVLPSLDTGKITGSGTWVTKPDTHIVTCKPPPTIVSFTELSFFGSTVFLSASMTVFNGTVSFSKW